MPDRAVVDTKTIRAALQKVWDDGCDKCGGTMVMWADIGDMRCQQCGRTGDEIEGELLGPPQPRALVALSEDRKDMVLLSHTGWWLGFRRVTNDFKYITLACKDAGQSAEQALGEWMADDE